MITTRTKQKRQLCANNSLRGLAMSEKKQSVEEVMQKIDQLLDVLKDISQDLADISKALKTARAPSPAPVTAPAQTPVPAPTRQEDGSTKEVRALFPKELEEMLFFEDQDEYIIIKPRRFLGSENFAKIASIIRGAGGEYVSAGRDSHFKISKEAR